MALEAATIAQVLLTIIEKRPGLNRSELATAIYGSADVGSINRDLDYLVDQGLVTSDTTTGVLRYNVA